MSGAGQRVREILAGPRCVVPGSVFDPVSARLAAELGFEMGMLGGSVAALAILGAPDLILITLTELAEQVRRICRAAALPLMVDADHGYGNALNVMRTVQELEAAGAAALSIEDTALPVAFGGGDALIPLTEAVGKMRAALAGRRNPATVIVGRTGAAGATAAEINRRARAYAETGVDAVFLTGIRTAEQLREATAGIRLPVVLGGGKPGGMSFADIEALGVRIALQGHPTFPAAVKAMHAALTEMRAGRTAGAELVADAALMKRATAADGYAAWTRDFLDRS